MMDYRAELQILLDHDTMTLKEWLSNYPLTESPALIHEFKIHMQKFLIDEGDFETVQALEDELSEATEHIENLIFDKLVREQEICNLIEKLKAKLEVLRPELEKKSPAFKVPDDVYDDMLELIAYNRSNGVIDTEITTQLKEAIHHIRNESKL